MCFEIEVIFLYYFVFWIMKYYTIFVLGYLFFYEFVKGNYEFFDSNMFKNLFKYIKIEDR